MSRPTVFFPLAVFIVNVFIFYAFITDLCLQLMDSVAKRTSFVIAEAVFFIMSNICLCIAAIVQPGKVPEKFLFTEEEHAQFINSSEDVRDRILQDAINRKHLRILTFTKTGHIRYCMACKAIKPDRAHHCSVCKMCILKMDHHCPWINNCVGFFNYKIFLLLLFYHTFFCFLLIGGTIEIFVKDIELLKNHIPLLLAFAATILEGLFTISLFLYHIGLTLFNRTSIETFQKILFVDESYEFNLGKFRNWAQVFGYNVFLWFFPIHTAIGDGYNYSVSCGDVEEKRDRYIRKKHSSDVNWGDC